MCNHKEWAHYTKNLDEPVELCSNCDAEVNE